MKDLLLKLTEGKNLTQEETFNAILTIMKNEAEPAMTGAFLTALSIKGETPDEIVGAVKAMMEVAEIIEPGYDVLDIVVGNILAVRHDNVGNFTSIREEDIPVIESLLFPFGCICNETVFMQGSDYLPEYKEK